MSSDGAALKRPQRPTYREDDDQLGYKPVRVGSDVPEADSNVVAVNPKEQRVAERILWKLRRR